MSRWVVAALSVLVFTSCAASTQKSPSSLLGRWVLRSIPRDFEISCSGPVYIEFVSDRKMVVRSGAQIIRADYVLEPKGSGFLLKQQDIRHNGGPNCQNFTAEHVMKNYVPTNYIELRGEFLVFSSSRDPDGAVSLLVRE